MTRRPFRGPDGDVNFSACPDPAAALDAALDARLGRAIAGDHIPGAEDAEIAVLLDIATRLRSELSARPSPAAASRHQALIATVAKHQQARKRPRVLPIP